MMASTILTFILLCIPLLSDGAPPSSSLKDPGFIAVDNLTTSSNWDVLAEEDFYQEFPGIVEPSANSSNME